MSQSILSSLTADEESNFSEETEVFVFPTSFAQQRLWFLDQLASGNPFYNVSTALRLTGALNFTALKQTFNEIVRRHETLRTTFMLLQEPVQAIAPSLTIPLPLIDLRNVERQERETHVQQIATIEAQYPFDLTTGPLLRVKLLQLDEAEYVLLLNLHHIIADGWSIGVLVRELGIFYRAFVEDEQNPNATGAVLTKSPIISKRVFSLCIYATASTTHSVCRFCRVATGVAARSGGKRYLASTNSVSLLAKAVRRDFGAKSPQ